MALDWSTLALEAVNFLILVWLLQRFLYHPVLAAIDRRREATERILAQAEAARNEAQVLQDGLVKEREGLPLSGFRCSRRPKRTRKPSANGSSRRHATRRQRSGRKAMPALSTSAPRAWPPDGTPRGLPSSWPSGCCARQGIGVRPTLCSRRPAGARANAGREARRHARFGREPSRADHHRRALG